jgi:hypothetical protein
LENAIKLTKGKNNTYDCIVPVSGGRDSTYVLFAAKRELHLKVLAVSHDNEFRNEQALINIRNACKILDVDFISVRSRRNIAHKMVRSGIRCSPSLRLFGLCRACSYGYRSVVYRMAEKYCVPLILWGESQAEATQAMEKRAFDHLDLKGGRGPTLWNPNFFMNLYYSLMQRYEFPVHGNRILDWGVPFLKNKNIKELRLFDCIPWDRKKIKETITKELGWEKPKNHVSTWRTDCELHALVNYSYFKLFGCSKDCFGYCKMINGGQMKREEALEQEEKTIALILREIPGMLKNKIGLSTREIARIESR